MVRLVAITMSPFNAQPLPNQPDYNLEIDGKLSRASRVRNFYILIDSDVSCQSKIVNSG